MVKVYWPKDEYGRKGMCCTFEDEFNVNEEWLEWIAARRSWDEDWKTNNGGYVIRAVGSEGLDLAIHLDHRAVFVG